MVPATNLSIAWLRLWIPREVSLVGCEHAFITAAFAAGEYRGWFGKMYRLMLRPTYNLLLDRLVMLTDAARRDAVSRWHVRDDKIAVIPNPQDIPEILARAQEAVPQSWFSDGVPVFVAVGRLVSQKGFDNLIAAFSRVVAHRRARLTIIGQGPLESALKAQVESLKLDSHVEFMGFQANPFKYMKRADALVLTSIWEAMPMVIAEALVIGTPVIAYDCPSGPRELLNGGEYGVLVPDQDVEALAGALEAHLRNPEPSRALADRGARWAQTLGAPRIADQYLALMREAVGRRRRGRGRGEAPGTRDR